MAVPMGAKLGMGVMGALGMLGAGYGIGYYNRGGLGNSLANKLPTPTPTPISTPTPTPTPYPYATPEPGAVGGFRDINGYRNPVAA